jgi:hypothetical protein
MDEIESVLAEREKTHGDFSEVAEIAQTIKSTYRRSYSLSNVEIEALDLIATKIARIAAGDRLADHWLDIEGYARLARRQIDG